MEIFKAVQGYEDLYEVSNLGTVKSLSKQKWYGSGYWTTKERILRQRIHDGYYRVNLCGVGKMKTICVHILVINAFVEKEDGKPFTNHKDLNRLNNNSENLEWANNRENVQHGKTLSNKKRSKYPGVTRPTKGRPFARIRVNNEVINLGSYETEEIAYMAVLKYHKENNIINKYI